MATNNIVVKGITYKKVEKDFKGKPDLTIGDDKYQKVAGAPAKSATGSSSTKAPNSNESQQNSNQNTVVKVGNNFPSLWWHWLVLIAGIILALLLFGLLLKALVRPYNTGSSATGSSSSAAAPIASNYVCSAVAVGTPVSTDGKCSFCTVNYTKPGEVFIAGETPIDYTTGAYVFQYTAGNLDGFKSCVNTQGFMSDPNYQPIWK